MMIKENENLKKREYNFQGMLDSSEHEAELKFKDQEILEYKNKLNDERNKNSEYTQELKTDISNLKKQNLTLQNN
jgi:hypothetical protein